MLAGNTTNSSTNYENIKRAHYQGALWLNRMSGMLPSLRRIDLENIKRAHYQGALWLNRMSGMLPSLRRIDLGWEQDECLEAVDHCTRDKSGS